MERCVVVRIAGLRYALPMTAILRVVNAAEVTALPSAPTKFLGVLNVAGEIIPVVNLRQLLQLPTTDITSDSIMVFAKTTVGKIVLPVDYTEGIVEFVDAAHADEDEGSDGYIDRFFSDSDGILFGIAIDRLATEADYQIFADTATAGTSAGSP